MNHVIVVLQDVDVATSSNATILIEEETISGNVSVPLTEPVYSYPAAQQEIDTDWQDAVLLKLDTLIELGTYTMTFLMFCIVVVLIRCVYKFIRIFI